LRSTGRSIHTPPHVVECAPLFLDGSFVFGLVVFLSDSALSMSRFDSFCDFVTVSFRLLLFHFSHQPAQASPSAKQLEAVL
jgi:hypothetical protein